MFYGQCWKCGERWGLGTASTCKCPDETPKREWVGLTDDEIEAAIPFKDLSGEYYYDDVLNIVLFIQAKLKRKNT